jgi:ribonuclease R
MLDGKITEETVGRYEDFAAHSALLSSDNEVKAVHAERDIDDLYKSVYMRDRIGEEYEAVICSVTSFGFFAKTENLCEGLVPIDSLGGGFFYDRDNYTLSRGKTVYRLGQRVKIKVDDVDIAARQINFYLIKEEKGAQDKGEENAPVAFEKPKRQKGADKPHRRERSRAPKHKRRIFETFMQLEQKHKRKRRR